MMTYNPLHIPTHAYLVADADLYGAEAAALLYHIKYILQRNEQAEQNLFDDLNWYRIEKDELLKQFPYFKNRYKIEKLLKKLVNFNAIIHENHNENQSDQTKWYALKPAKNLNVLNGAMQCADQHIGKGKNEHEQNKKNTLKTTENLNVPNSPMQCADQPDALGQSAHCHIYNIDSKETLETPRKRVLDDGFGLLEFVERYNQIAQAHVTVGWADDVLFSAEGERKDKIHFIIEKYSRKQIDSVFAKIANNNWLLGQVKFSDGKPFYLSLAWLTKPVSFKNIIIGKYAKAAKPGTENNGKFKIEKNPYDGVTNWAEQAKILKNKPMRMIKTMLPRVEKYIETSKYTQEVVDAGQNDKLFVIAWNYLFPGNANLTNNDINSVLLTHKYFPDLYQKPALKVASGGES